LQNKKKKAENTELFTSSSEEGNKSTSSESAHKDSDPEVYETDMESTRYDSENEVESSNCGWDNDSDSDSELLLHNVQKSIEKQKKIVDAKLISKRSTEQEKMVKELKRKKMIQMEQSIANNKEISKKARIDEQKHTLKKFNKSDGNVDQTLSPENVTKKPNILPDLKRLKFTGKSSSSGFLDNFLNAIYTRKPYSDLYETVERFIPLKISTIEDTCREHPEIHNKTCWFTYNQQPKYYMILLQCLTRYFFQKKKVNKDLKTDFSDDIALLMKNTIHAVIFHTKNNKKTYTVFLMKDIVFAGGIFEYPKNIFGHFVTFVKKIEELNLDKYDIFEFKVGNITQENVMVKSESVKGDGSESKPIEFD